VLRYAARAVPWTQVALAAGLVLVLMDVVRRWPWTMWPLEGTAVGLLAGAAAWCFDEPSAAVVDSAPRSLLWRTTARSGGVVLLLAAWAAAVFIARDSLFGHPWEVAFQGVAAVLAVVAYTIWRRAGGDPNPGLQAALMVVPVATAWALIRPFSEALPVFPYADGSTDFGDWGVSLAGWAVVAGCGVVLLAAALTDVRWWSTRSIRPTRRTRFPQGRPSPSTRSRRPAGAGPSPRVPPGHQPPPGRAP
jgi:hypothetical protein